MSVNLMKQLLYVVSLGVLVLAPFASRADVLRLTCSSHTVGLSGPSTEDEYDIDTGRNEITMVLKFLDRTSIYVFKDGVGPDGDKASIEITARVIRLVDIDSFLKTTVTIDRSTGSYSSVSSGKESNDEILRSVDTCEKRVSENRF